MDTWQKQWRAIMAGYMALGRCYSGQHSDSDMGQILVVFCRDCYDLAACLETDSSIPLPIRQAVRPHVAESFNLLVAETIVNPEYVGHTTTSTLSEENPPRTTMRIEWERPDGLTGRKDGLDFAAAAVSEWRMFLSRHKLM